MGRPSGVTNADLARDGSMTDSLGQRAQLAGALADLDPLAVQDCDPGRVVAAVLQAAERVQDDRRALRFSDVAHDPAHVIWSRLRLLGVGACPAYEDQPRTSGALSSNTTRRLCHHPQQTP